MRQWPKHPPKRVKIYSDEIEFGDSLVVDNPKWLENALNDFYARGVREGRDEIRRILKELVK